MTRVQVLLVVACVAATVIYFSWLRSKLWDRAVVLVLALFGVYLVLDPDMATRVAHVLGVGRGVDLLFYVSFLGLSFLVLLLFSKIRLLEDRLIQLARATAEVGPHAAEVHSDGLTSPATEGS